VTALKQCQFLKEQKMTKMPPVPADNRSPKGPGDDKADPGGSAPKISRETNTGQQGQQGNIKQNTSNQGYQQDR
jgi:hypothetical protein